VAKQPPTTVYLLPTTPYEKRLMTNNDFYIQLDDLTLITTNMVVKVKNFSWNVTGGPHLAEVEITGPDVWSTLHWLAKRIEIRNRNQRRVWWGFVEEVFVNDGVNSYGLSIKEMFNRVRVAYTYEVFGVPTSGTTTWAFNQAAIDAIGFIKEKEVTQEVNASPEMAAAYRDNILTQVAKPVPVTRSGSSRGKELSATLYLAGDIHSFEWRLYSQLAGLEANQPDGGGADQLIGQGFTSSRIGFVPSGKISAIDGEFTNFVSGSQVRISNARAGDNNGTFTISSVDSRPPIAQDMNVAGWNFDPNDDIKSNPTPTDLDADDIDIDSLLETDDYIRINNVPLNPGNRGFFRIRETGENAVVVINKTIVSETPPVGSILYRGNYIMVGDSLVREFPLNSITITTVGTRVAQRVLNGTGSAWTVDAIEIPIRRVNSPSDSIRLLFMADNGGTPGTVLETVDIAGTDVSDQAGNTELFKLSNTRTFQPGVYFWIHLQRTGAHDPGNYYVVEVDEDQGYTRGNLLVWDGTGWIARTPQADLIFRMLGAVETTKQIATLVDVVGQLVGQTDIRVTTVTSSNQYRDGTTYAYDELMGLLEAGRTAAGRRIIAVCTADRYLRITEAPINTAKNYYYTRDGEFRFWNNGSALEPGILPVGEWIWMDGLPPVIASAYPFSPKFLEEAEYDCESGEIRPTWQGEKNVWESMG